MSFTVSVEDTSLPYWASETSPYVPELYHFKVAHPSLSIELINVVETWKNLKHIQAHELRFWHNALRTAIEQYLHDTLIGNFGESQIRADARQMHAYVQGLGYQEVTCDMAYLVDNMMQQQRAARRQSSWLEWDKRTALTNFIRLHHCFYRDQPTLNLYFYSELTDGGGLHVFARMSTNPHVFDVDHYSRIYTYQSPCLDEDKSFYPVQVSEPKRDEKSDAWLLTVSTLFPHDAKFERVFRFRYKAHNPSQPPGPIERPIPISADRRKVRKKLREISQASVRVQGTSDFEQAARQNHPQLYRAHHDHIIGKGSVLGKLYGHRTPSPQRPTTNIMHDVQDQNKTHQHTISFRSRSILNDSGEGTPLLSPTHTHVYDEDDSMFAFSPARPGSQQPLSEQETPSERLQSLFASSPGRLACHSLSLDQGNWSLRGPRFSPSPRASTAIWLDSESSHQTSSPNANEKASKRQSYEQVLVRKTPESLSTAEILVPESVDSIDS